MNIEQIISLLPKELLNDAYFEHIINMVTEDFKNENTKALSKIIVAPSIYEYLTSKNNFMKSTDNTLLHFLYTSNNKVISFGIKVHGEDFHVYYEVQEQANNKRTVLVKTPVGSVIETKKISKKDGYYTNYETEAYYYDSDYKMIKTDTEKVKDELFSSEFGIPLELSRVFRKSFSKYAIPLSRSATELKMRQKSFSIPKKELFLFIGATTIEYLKSYILSICLEHNKDNYPTHLDRLDNIINKLSTFINPTFEIIISNNIITNLLPSILGLDADGYYIEGFIIEKNDDSFVLYELRITTNHIEHTKHELTKEELEELLTINIANSTNPNITKFINSFNRQ